MISDTMDGWGMCVFFVFVFSLYLRCYLVGCILFLASYRQRVL